MSLHLKPSRVWSRNPQAWRVRLVLFLAVFVAVAGLLAVILTEIAAGIGDDDHMRRLTALLWVAGFLWLWSLRALIDLTLNRPVKLSFD